jgi:uncharacterized membrane protein
MRKLLFVVFCIFALLIGAYPLIYVFVEHKNTFLSSKTPAVLGHTVWRSAFFAHIIFAGISLFIGWTQFGGRFRRNHLKLHRIIGKIYVISALIGSLSGIYLGFYANGGPVAALGFMCLGSIWFISTLAALLEIRKKNIVNHQQLMVYSYACAFAAVTLRLWYPLLVKITEDDSGSYITVAWLCWVPNVLAAYFINKRNYDRSKLLFRKKADDNAAKF